jgi:hypothetical protein
MDKKPTLTFQNNLISRKTGDKLIMVLVENIDEIQGMEFYAYCCTNIK